MVRARHQRPLPLDRGASCASKHRSGPPLGCKTSYAGPISELEDEVLLHPGHTRLRLQSVGNTTALFFRPPTLLLRRRFAGNHSRQHDEPIHTRPIGSSHRRAAQWPDGPDMPPRKKPFVRMRGPPASPALTGRQSRQAPLEPAGTATASQTGRSATHLSEKARREWHRLVPIRNGCGA